MDFADDAQARAHTFLQAALANAQNKTQQGPSRTVCEDCGDPIPAARQKAVPGVRLCINCQQELEA